ncbi:hypothetical protein H6P81_014886 [Aristolochia fimbriata]|uniref:Uncharacterized protein n=1 Tax=Aristolochia fimbriata TaxID=158543 RepID=A0AAV7E6U7_ARIFI|nr:hypothetical protein H6P81_014886 [Aristolochia fimbriata]
MGFVETRTAGNAFRRFTETLVTLNGEDRVKEVDVNEGGFLDVGYTFYRTRFEIVEKGPNMATVKKSIIYEIQDEFAANESLASIDENPAQVKAVEDFLTNRRATDGLIRGEQIISVDIPFSAQQVWDVYANTEQLAQIFKNVPGTALEDIQVVGDGGLGTLIILILRPGSTFRQFTETLVTLDHGQRVKEVDVSEGGYLTVGYTFYRTRFEILSKGPNRATVRKSIIYNLREDSAANLALAAVNENPDQVKAVENFLNGSSSTSTESSNPGFIM